MESGFRSVRNQVKGSAQHGNLGTAYMIQVLIHIQKPMAQNIAVMLVQPKEIIVLLQIQLHRKKFAAVLGNTSGSVKLIRSGDKKVISGSTVTGADTAFLT